MISSLLTTVAVAAVDTNKAAREGISDVIYQVKNDTSYVEPKNTFDDNSPTYYYVTTDAAETSGTSKTVTKDKKLILQRLSNPQMISLVP